MPMVEATCGALLKLDPITGAKFCGALAVFRYEGLLPKPDPNKPYAKVLAERGRYIVDLCLDHSREMLTRMDAEVKDGKVKMISLQFDRNTLRCKICYSLFRIEKKLPSVSKEELRYCPSCGGTVTEVTKDPELDYWEMLSADLELPLMLTRRIYTLWQSDRTATGRFIDYVRDVMRELDAEA